NTFKGPTEIDSGSLLVNGSLDPASVVTVESGAALGGTGTIGGPVVVESGGTLAPGGFITISNSLTLSPGSTTFMRINASTGGSDSAKQISTLNYAGTLVVSNIDGTVVPGLSFQLFSANARTGDFQQIQSAVPDVRWSFDAISGRLTALPSIATCRTNLLFTVTGQTLTLTWPGSHQGWIVQSNSVGLANLSGWQDIPGSESATHLSITITPAASNVFYRLRSP
ncbi:MAG TPA: hypothetical protein VHH88_02450, partial [Verrucomicrobiae bacterium]|nr:hypothetical protein [Verrucomicrobiae bacterium]